MTTFGIDISYYQTGLNLSSAIAQGKQFVMCRISRGDKYADPTFGTFYLQAKSAKLLFAAYHFLRSDSSPEVQAQFTYNCLPDKTLEVMLDVERTSDGTSKPTWDQVKRYLAEADRIGMAVTLLYLPRWYWAEIGSPALPAYPRLVSSRYGANDGRYQGDTSDLWSGYGGQTPVILQYSSRGSYSGYSGFVDQDAFRGTRQELSALGLFRDFGGNMATSQNGWPVVGADQIIDKRVLNVEFPNGWLKGPIDVIFTDLITQLNKIEPIHSGWCWGYYVKRIEGSSTYSNHASGTAIDYNAPIHPMGSRGTWSAGDTTAVRSLLKNRYSGLIRWGGDYSGRADEMHFEFIGTKTQASTLAARLTQQPPIISTPTIPADWTDKMIANLPTIGVGSTQLGLVRTIQGLLLARGHSVVIDGQYGPATKAAVLAYQNRVGTEVRNGTVGAETWAALILARDAL